MNRKELFLLFTAHLHVLFRHKQFQFYHESNKWIVIKKSSIELYVRRVQINFRIEVSSSNNLLLLRQKLMVCLHILPTVYS